VVAIRRVSGPRRR